MSHSTFTLFVGVFSVALYLSMTIFVVLFATVFNAAAVEMTTDADTSAESLAVIEESSKTVFGFSFLLLADFVIMFIASILMVYGVKKERHHYIAPWLILNAIGVVLELFVLFSSTKSPESESNHSVFVYALSTVIFAAIWYPVFHYYQTLKNLHHAAVQGCHSSGAGCVAPAHVYPVPSDYSHVNAKYVPTAMAAAHQIC